MVGNLPTEVRSQIDELMPQFDFRAAYETQIRAPAAVAYDCLLRLDFREISLVRFLITLRTGRRVPCKVGPSDLRQRLTGGGFVILAEIPNEELVIGVAGRFWRPDGGRCADLTAEAFPHFSRAGYAKVAWNFRLKSDGPASSVLSTETRIQCFDSARWKFRLYWSVVGPFSGLIRKAILKHVKVKAESQNS